MEIFKGQVDMTGEAILVYNEDRTVQHQMGISAESAPVAEFIRKHATPGQVMPKCFFHGFIDKNQQLVIAKEAPWQNW